MNPDSVLPIRRLPARAEAAVAALLALLLVLAGAVTAPAAYAAGPTVWATAVPRAGGTITVTGSGFAGVSPGVYLAVGPAGLPGFYAGSAQLLDTVWVAPGNVDGGSGAGRTAPMGEDGSFSVQLTVPADTDGAQYALYTSKAHGQGFQDPSQNTVTTLAWEPLPATATSTSLTASPEATAVEGTEVTLTATVSPAAAGTVAFSAGGTALGSASVDAGTASLTTASLPVGTLALTAAFTPADAAAFTGSSSGAVSYAVTAEQVEPEPQPTPTVTVSKTSGIDPAGETVTATGSGFLPNPPATSGARPPLAGRFTGAYVVFGSFLDDWRPSAGAPSSARKGLDTKWGVHEADVATIGGATRGAIVIQPDGTFETTLMVAESEAALADGNYGIYTYPGGGAAYAPFETSTPIAFAEEEPTPSLRVEIAEVGAANGASIRVTGEDLGAATGAYAAVIEEGRESDVTAGGGYVAFATPFPTVAGGSTTFTIVAPTAKLDRTKRYEVLVWQQHTMPNASTIMARADVPFSAQDWATLLPPVTPPVDPQAPAGPPVNPVLTPADAGSLRWAISSSFASYVTGDIAKGSIAVANGATRSAGLFQFGQGTGSAYDPATGTGTVAYAGSVRYTGHAGLLDVTIANPQVRITSPSSASLSVSSGGSQVLFATLDLAAGSRSVSGAAVTYSGVPATLTAAGRSQIFQGFDTNLDDLTFTVGVAGAAPTGSTGTVAAASATTAKATTATVPQTPVAPVGGCTVADATLNWGFKETFRSYIEGIAAGGWELSGVEYAFPEYVWSGGAGAVDLAAGMGLVTYGGSIRFTGHGGALDTTLANARIELAGDTGYVVLDVSGTTQGGTAVQQNGVRLAQFDLPPLEPRDGALLLEGLPATLTNAGAAAFGTYPAGAQLDPVTAVIPVDATCGAPAVDDGAAAAGAPEATTTSADAQPAPVWPWAVVGIALVLAVGAAVWVVTARRRAATAGGGTI